jgi:hypothetical protein
VNGELISKRERDPSFVTAIVVVTFVQAGAVIVTEVVFENVMTVFVVEIPADEERETLSMTAEHVHVRPLKDSQAKE